MRRNEAGVSLLAVVLAMGVLAFLGMTFADLVVQQQYAAVNEPRALQALYVAEAGFELAIQEYLENVDKAFNGAAADGVIGAITNVPLGAGTVSVSKGGQTPPVFTSTGTVGDVRRVLAMTIDLENLVKLDPVFNDATNLATNWPETISDPQGSSAIASAALRTQTNVGSNLRFRAQRDQTLNPTIPVDRRIVARNRYMRDRTAPSTTVNRHQIELQLVDSVAVVSVVWSSGNAAVTDADKGVWKQAEVRGWPPTSTTQIINKVRLFYRLETAGVATAQAFGWFDDIEVLVVKRSAWSEP